MKANTAVALACAGVAVLCLGPGTNGLTRRIGWLLALLVALFGVLVIWEYVVGGVGIDQVLFRDGAGSFPGRPSPETALALIALGSSLAAVDGRGRWRRAHVVLLGISATVVLFGVVGDIYGVDYTICVGAHGSVGSGSILWLRWCC
jgi:hypothetical protein